MFATDPVGMEALLLTGTIFQKFNDKRDAVNLGEYGLSRSILEAGYGVDCLVAQLQGLDWREPGNWPGPAGLEWAATINQMRAQSGTTARFVYALHPFEAVFVKTLWGEASGDAGEQELGQVDESIAEPLSWVIEELQTAFASKSTDSDSALDGPISGPTL
uniref:Uncharacterized protein n=1 Tax=Cryptomonas curvata TaxID=233186 RepID=A0A7S0QX65_9CRYP|mmetsp:Transcript_57181/g.119570  ORF Transcript_57181/g.119570 Transcript_57181/m.119570 type:complete len:161 (+) Transcript_57181:142-624(+)